MNVCVSDIATIKTTRIIGFIPKNIDAERDKSIEPTRFICIPGATPVNVPARIPKNKKMRISINILY